MFIIKQKTVSKVAFLFVAYVVISGGVLSKGLSCQLQKALETNLYLQHVIGLLLIYTFIMLEGGWDFKNEENNKAPRDWSSGNSIHSFVYSILIYGIFVLSSKMRLLPNIIFLFLLLLLYMTSTQTSYWEKRNRMNHIDSVISSTIQRVLFILSTFVFIYGIGDYYLYQSKEYGKNFSMFNFLLGTPICNYEKK